MRALAVRRLNAVSRYWQPLGLLVVTWVAMTIWVPDFGGETGVYAVLEYLARLGLVALGISVTMIAGELDLSVASMAAFAAIIAAAVSRGGLVVAILVPLLVCGLIGAIQGAAIARFKVNSLMFTIGTLIMFRGLAYVLSNSQTLVMADLSLSNQLDQQFWVLSPSSIIALVAFAAVGMFLIFLRPGRYIYAVGGGRREAEAAGVSTPQALTIAFAISALCAGLAGALAAVRDGAASPGDLNDLLLPAVAAALIGGIGLSGGRGSVINVLLGVGVLGAISTALTVRGSDPSVTQLVLGGLLLVVLVLEFSARYLSTVRATARGA